MLRNEILAKADRTAAAAAPSSLFHQKIKNALFRACGAGFGLRIDVCRGQEQIFIKLSEPKHGRLDVTTFAVFDYRRSVCRLSSL